MVPSGLSSRESCLAPEPEPSCLGEQHASGLWQGSGIGKRGNMMSVFLFPLLGLLLNLGKAQALVSPNELQQLSTEGSKYIDAEIENAINGVKQMKNLMDKTGKDHQQILNTLEKAKKEKEEAIQLAKETEKQLNEKPEVCNETMMALWEECKPCLKHTCMKFYSRVCRSGSGLVGRQLEEFLNQSSPFSIWLNGERMDSLLEEDLEQDQRLDNLEENFSLMEQSIDDLFQDSSMAYGQMHPIFHSPFLGVFQDPMRSPFRGFRFPFSSGRVVRDTSSFFPRHQGFQHLFQPLFEMTRRMMEGTQRALERENQWDVHGRDSSLGGFLPEYNATNDRMVCREIRRNSAGCLKMKDQCAKCQEILSIDCSETDPLQSQLREKFEDALRVAEKFSKKYDELLQSFQMEMLNMSVLLDQLNKQFGWVSQLANVTQNSNGIFQVTTLLSKSSNPEDPSIPSDTEVVVHIFDSDPISLTIPGEIPWNDPKFMEMVAEEALRQYKQNAAGKIVM
ncbi:clusterin isoform X2 [Ornithorhynchus anatinus]|uniref:clusterin isoform X2 n=1 Tax=Ornithorhynchus anatinus TaxID=9258 RepID=UPI0010A7CAE6|nr:clusterin isoform X2 [Ornithorhynchus anatinus]